MATQTPITEKRVDEIMTKRVETLTPNDTIKEAVNLMIDSKVNTVPVVDHENKCVGILSRTDLTEMFMEEDNHLTDVLDTERLSMDWVHHSLETSNKKLVKELMNYDVATVRNLQKLTDACHLMSLHQVHHLPVVDDLDAVVGIISTFDIVAALAKEY
jgi:CBS domain-containing protein